MSKTRCSKQNGDLESWDSVTRVTSNPFVYPHLNPVLLMVTFGQEYSGQDSIEVTERKTKQKSCNIILY